uniref:RING-type E3 ubiquitin transferase n=1 Tax=Nomascus leucogenys TaxID=61853 RepID=A0A2I3GL23_NOMLE
MSLDLSSDCECPNCWEGPQNESDWNPCSNESGNGSLHSRSRKKSMLSSSMQCFPSQCCPTKTESGNKDSAVLPSDEESYVESSQNDHLILSLEDIKRKIKPLREWTIHELLREFGDSGKFQPDSMSLSYFRDQVVMKPRRALYYSGIWVTHIRGYKPQKHFTANYFKRNPGCLHLLVPWLTRELTAVFGDYGYTSFTHLLEPYLLQHTHHFLHEFITIYQCSPASPCVNKKPLVSAPVSPLPKDHTLLISQHNTKQSKNTQGQWNKEERPVSGLKQFPNGNPSLKKSEIPPVCDKTVSKTCGGIDDKAESGDHKSIISMNNILQKWATPRERCPGLLNCKKKVQEKKTEGIKLFPDHVHDLGKGDTTAHTFSIPAISNQVQPQKYSLRERKGLSLGQKINFQKKEEENNKYSDSSPKTFQRLSRERSLKKRDPSWSCISENAFSPKRDDRKLSSFRKKRMKCRQPSQFVEIGSHSRRRIQRRSRSNTHRSKSWCVGSRKRLVSRESSNLSLRGSHRSEHFTQNICCEPSKEKHAHGNESDYGRPSSTTVQYMKLSSTAGKRCKCPSKSEGASQAGRCCNSPTCLQLRKHRSPSKQEIKQETTFPRAGKTRAVRHRKTKCHYLDIHTTEDVSDELGNLDDIRQKSGLSVHPPAGGKSTKNSI